MQTMRRRTVPYLYLSPALLSILIMTVLPSLFTIYLAFTDASLYTFRTGPNLVGLANFVDLLVGPFSQAFLPVLGWNILYASLSVLTQFAVGLFLALLLNNPNMRESNLYRAILIIPWAIPATLAVLAWKGLLNTSAGSINLALGSLFGLAPIPWLQEPGLARLSVILVNLWLGFPWFMTVCLGALQSIPTDIYEAAEIDGAGIPQRFWRLTFPLIMRMSLPLMIGSFAHNFNNFGTAFLMTEGGPVRPGVSLAGHTDILISVGYKLTVNQYRYGLSAALSLVLFIIVAVISLINMRATGAFGEEG